MTSRNLIVFYSYSGNTKKIAEIIQAKVGGEMLELKVKESYPSVYKDLLEMCKREIKQSKARAVVDMDIDINNYDHIFIGSPNWCNTYAPPINAFFEAYNTSDKIIYPFCIHGGGGHGRIFSDIAKTSNSEFIKNGFSTYGDGGSKAEVEVSKWLDLAFSK